MKNLFILLVTIAAFTSVSAQKKVYDENVEIRSAKDFHAVQVAGGIDLLLTSGEEAVAVSASENKYRDKIKVEVENGVLKISYDDKSKFSFGDKKNLKAYVSYKTLDKLSAVGGCDVVVEGSIKSKDLSINIIGGSEFKGNVEVENLNVELIGGSDMEISGWAKKVNIEATGGCDLSGYDLKTDVCEIKSTGASDVDIAVSKEISSNATGASDINYKGNPSVKNIKTSGASSVTQKS